MYEHAQHYHSTKMLASKKWKRFIIYFTVIHIYFLVPLKPNDKFYNIMNFINFVKKKLSKDYEVQVFIGNIRLKLRNKLK